MHSLYTNWSLNIYNEYGTIFSGQMFSFTKGELIIYLLLLHYIKQIYKTLNRKKKVLEWLIDKAGWSLGYLHV